MSNTDVAERQLNPIAEVRHQLASMEEQFKFALPSHIPVERFGRVVMTALQNNPKLVTHCTRQSLWNACMKAAQDGLLPDGREGAIVQNGDQAGWRPMIAGIRKKVRNSGEIATWDVHVVHAKDKFAYRLGDDPFIAHEPSLDEDPGPTIAAYSIAQLKGGEKSRDVMSIGSIRKIRDRSDAWKAFKAGKIKSTPWQTDEDEMAKKTVARRHSKVLPMSTDLDDLMRRDDDLYEFDKAKASEQVDHPQTLADKLDILASSSLPVMESPSTTIDKSTGEIIESITTSTASPGGEAPGAGTAGEADPDDASSADNSQASPQPTAKTSAGTAAPGRAAPNPEPSQGKGSGAAKAADQADTSNATAPKNEAEYVRYADAWRESLTDAGEGEKRWASEKTVRNKAQVGADARESLQEKLAAKCAEIRDADRS